MNWRSYFAFHVAFIALVFSLFVSSYSTSQAREINIASITARSIAAFPSCSRWRVTGVCFFLRCTLAGCSIRESIKVGHYNADAVVTVYNEIGETPWTEMRLTYGFVQKLEARLFSSLIGVRLGGHGNGTEGTTKRDHRNLIFREAEVIGNPAVFTINSMISALGVACPSGADPYQPYLFSVEDFVAWRSVLPDFTPGTNIPGSALITADLVGSAFELEDGEAFKRFFRDLGEDSPLNSWGNVFPRTGFVHQSEEAKAAALIAQRAGNIVTQADQPHVYNQIPEKTTAFSGPTAYRVIPPGELKEADFKTGMWQPLAPNASNSCDVFGKNDLTSTRSWADGKNDDGGDYAYILWRPYQCCQKKGQRFLYEINFMDYP